MSRVAMIGEPLRIQGYGLAGAVLCPASDRAAAIQAWHDLPDDIAVAVLTPAAAHWLAGETAGRTAVLSVSVPEPEEALP